MVDRAGRRRVPARADLRLPGPVSTAGRRRPAHRRRAVERDGGLRSIAVGDLNNDGINDLTGLKASGDVDAAGERRRRQRRHLGLELDVAAGSGYDRISVADLNNDGKRDLIGHRPNGDIVLHTTTPAAATASPGSPQLDRRRWQLVHRLRHR